MNGTRLILVGVASLGIMLATASGCRRDESPEPHETTVPKSADSATPKETEHAHAHAKVPAPARTEEAAHNHGHSHGHEETPTTYMVAIEAVATELAEIERLLAEGNIAGAHGPCDAIVGISAELPKLAMATDSGVAKEDVKTVNQTQKLLAAKANKAHAASEDGNVDEIRAMHAEMLTLLGKLHDLAPAVEHDHDHDNHDHDNHDHGG